MNMQKQLGDGRKPPQKQVSTAKKPSGSIAVGDNYGFFGRLYCLVWILLSTFSTCVDVKWLALFIEMTSPPITARQ
jgi:hypothetical protein